MDILSLSAHLDLKLHTCRNSNSSSIAIRCSLKSAGLSGGFACIEDAGSDACNLVTCWLTGYDKPEKQKLEPKMS